MQFLLICVLFLSFAALFVVCDNNNNNNAIRSFSFYDYLQGDWDISRSVLIPSLASINHQEEIKGRLSLARDNNTNNALRLIGRAYDNDTMTIGSISNERLIAIDFDSNNAGVWKSGTDDDSYHALFSFDIQQTPSTSFALSSGPYSSSYFPTDKTNYLLSISSIDRFSLTIYTNIPSVSNDDLLGSIHGMDAADEKKQKKDNNNNNNDNNDDTTTTTTKSSSQSVIIVYTARKIVTVPEKSFFQKYGTFLLLGGFFMVNMYIKSKNASSMMQRQAAAAVKAKQNAAKSQ